VCICVCATRDSNAVPDRETVCRPKLEYIYNRVWLWHFCPPGAYTVPTSCTIIILLLHTICVRTTSYILQCTLYRCCNNNNNIHWIDAEHGHTVHRVCVRNDQVFYRFTININCVSFGPRDYRKTMRYVIAILYIQHHHRYNELCVSRIAHERRVKRVEWYNYCVFFAPML